MDRQTLGLVCRAASSQLKIPNIFASVTNPMTVYLHAAGDALPLPEDLVQGLGAQDVPQRGLGQQSRAVVGVLNIGHRDCGVGDPVVDNGICKEINKVGSLKRVPPKGLSNFEFHESYIKV